MKVSVVIPVFNDHSSLERCLAGLEQQTLSSNDFEVIIVDNGSSEPVRVDYDGHHRVEVETRPGSYAARNKGIAVARAPIIAFTDADCIPSPGWLASAVAFLNDHPDVASIGGSVQVFPQDPEHRTPIEIYEAEHGFPQQVYVEKRRFAATANLLVRSNVFDAVGTFSSDLRSGGDVEFGNRSIDAGYPMRYVASAMVRHPARRSFESYTKKQRRTMSGTRDLASLRGNPYPYPIPGAMRNLLPPFRSILRAIGDPTIGPLKDRLKYSVAIVVTHYARAFYRFFLRRNGSSPR
ncbi:MAG: glycosyltransferase [Actinomycetia bacterium]|nr:glycosyltransferase [Actinomycetes bacterium]